MTVSITLEDGTIYKNLDCTPLEETVVTSEEIPEERTAEIIQHLY